MVANLLRLKLLLLRNGFRRSPWQLVGIILGGVYGLFVMALLVAGLIGLHQTSVTVAGTAVVLGGSIAMLAWAIVPVVAGGVDMTLDPARFTSFPIPVPRLLMGMTLAGLIGIPGVATLLVSLATLFTWARGPLVFVGALVGSLMAVLSCVVLSRLVATVTTNLSASRRFRDVSRIIAFIPLMLLGPIVATTATAAEKSTDVFISLAQAFAWTPLGAAWSIPAELAAGHLGFAGLKFLIALVSLLVFAWLWKISMDSALVNPPHNSAVKRSGGKLGYFNLFSSTPTGAVAARCLSYWFRDPRYGGSLVVLPLMAVLFYFVGTQNGNFGQLLFLGPLTAFLLAWSISSDVSYDNTAFALHVATGTAGRADRWGRVIACAVFAVPVTLVFVLGACAITSRWDLVWGLLGASIGVLGSGFGLASVVSARYTTPVPHPGESPFKRPAGNTAQTMAVQFGGMGILTVLVAPELVLCITQLRTDDSTLGLINLLVGPLLGGILMILGVRVGGRWLDARAPELLAQLRINK
ncbi:transporter [Pseudarthrobacter sp. J1763]|uniref:transporter n=1 Tax=Pseudarthrobacter sp. J1763 TaxID=3420445 RepID=UPI003D26BE0E